MSYVSRQILAGASILIFLISGCSGLAVESSPRVDESPVGQTQLPAATATSTNSSPAPLIPMTGIDAVIMQCQFCVAGETHAVLILPEAAYFDVLAISSPAGCLTADVVNGRRILICRGAQSTTFNLNICSTSSNCLLFPVALQPCDLLQPATPFAPILLTPHGVRDSDEDREPARPASTSSPAATQQVQPSNPTVQPPETSPPAPTQPPVEPANPPQNGGGEEGGDIVICHVSPGNPDQRQTMTVGLSAWRNSHSKHGDSRGPCE